MFTIIDDGIMLITVFDSLVQVALGEESCTCILFAFCFEETCIFWGNSGEAGTGVSKNGEVLDAIIWTAKPCGQWEFSTLPCSLAIDCLSGMLWVLMRFSF